MIFDPLFELMDIKPLNGWFILISLVLILGLMLWVSYDDIIKQTIVFWKLFIAGSASIILPFIYSFISGNGWKQILAYGLSIILYLIILVINIKFNNDRFMGKGDVDIIAAPLSLTIGASLWQVLENSGPILGMNLSYIWFNFLAYFTVGLVIGTVVFLLWFSIQVLLGKTSVNLLMNNTNIPVVPTLIVCVVMTSYTLMLI